MNPIHSHPHCTWIALLSGVVLLFRAVSAEPAREIPLYGGIAPGSESWNWMERAVTTKSGLPMVQDVVRPALLHFPAERTSGVPTAVIVAPGGGFRTLMMSYEGTDIARKLNQMGVDAFVLKYRLMYSGPGAPTNTPAPPSGPGEPPRRFTVTGAYKAQSGQDLLEMASRDGREAVRLVRQRAAEFQIQPNRVGMIGFSAGGIVTSETIFGPAETRPDFAAIIYGAGDIREIPMPAPPLFLAVAADDTLSAARSLDLFGAYRRAGGKAELHIYQMGAHGFVNKGGGADHFMDRLGEWLAANQLLAR